MLDNNGTTGAGGYPPGFHSLPLDKRNEHFAREYRRIVAEAAAKPKVNGRASADVITEAPPPESSDVCGELTTANDNADQGGKTHMPRSAKLFPLIMADNIVFDLEGEDLIDGILPKVGVAMLYGKSATLKSFVAVDWHMSIEKGEEWGGRRVQKGASIYVAAEGAGGLTKRKVGYVMRRGLLAGASFAMIPVAPKLGTEKGDLDAIIATIEASGLKPALITIDTASKSLASGDENGTGMQTLLNNADALALHFQCCVLIVHHIGVGENADKRPRGFSGSTGNVEALILCEREDKALRATLTLQKMKDGEDGIAFVVDVERVEIGVNKRGKVHSTLVVCAAAETETKTPTSTKQEKATPGQRLLVEVVAQAVGEAGSDFRPFGNDGPLVRAVDDEIVRKRYYERIAERAEPGDDKKKLAERQRKNFNRDIEGAVKRKALFAAKAAGGRRLWLELPIGRAGQPGHP
jgi:hypothetical protein